MLYVIKLNVNITIVRNNCFKYLACIVNKIQMQKIHFYRNLSIIGTIDWFALWNALHSHNWNDIHQFEIKKISSSPILTWILGFKLAFVCFKWSVMFFRKHIESKSSFTSFFTLCLSLCCGEKFYAILYFPSCDQR